MKTHIHLWRKFWENYFPCIFNRLIINVYSTFPGKDFPRQCEGILESLCRTVEMIRCITLTDSKLRSKQSKIQLFIVGEWDFPTLPSAREKKHEHEANQTRGPNLITVRPFVSSYRQTSRKHKRHFYPVLSHLTSKQARLLPFITR